MRTTLKIILIIVAFVLTAILVGISKALTGSHNSTGPLGIVFMVAFLAGARAIWRYDPNKNSTSTDVSKKSEEQQLDKS